MRLAIRANYETRAARRDEASTDIVGRIKVAGCGVTRVAADTAIVVAGVATGAATGTAAAMVAGTVAGAVGLVLSLYRSASDVGLVGPAAWSAITWSAAAVSA